MPVHSKYWDRSADITNINDLISLSSVALLLLGIFVGALVVIIKRWLNKKRTIYGAQFTGQNVYLQYQNLEKKKSMEHFLSQKEEKKQDLGGDDLSRFFN
jgi:hypothetical protein